MTPSNALKCVVSDYETTTITGIGNMTCGDFLKVMNTKVYYCKKCDRFTDVRYLQDRFKDRVKAYCYKCGEESLQACEVRLL